MSPGKILPLLLVSLIPVLPARAASPDNSIPPRGRFAELHSCEVFAGPCVVNSEVNQAGNYALRVWQFDQGSLGNVPLRGLTVALLEKSDENLADKGSASDAVAYLPPGLSLGASTGTISGLPSASGQEYDQMLVRLSGQTGLVL